MRLDPAKALRQVQQRQEQIMQELANKTVEVTVGGGAVRLVMTGQQQIKELTIAPEVVNPQEVEMLQDLIVAAVNEALERSRDMAEEQMRSLLGGLGIPGLR